MLAFLANFLGMFLFFEGSWQAIRDFVVVFVSVGTFAFFIFWGVVILICLGFAGIRQKYWVTGVLFFFLLATFWITGAISPHTWAYENPWYAGVIFVGYFIVATGWMTVRWVKYIKKVRLVRAKLRKDFLSKNFINAVFANRNGDDEAAAGSKKRWSSLGEAVEQLKSDERTWYDEIVSGGVVPSKPQYLTQSFNEQCFSSRNSCDHEGLKDIGTPTSAPELGNHKKEYFTYFFYWPLDVLIFFLGEFVRDLWNFVVEKVQATFNKYAAKYIRQEINVDDIK